MQRNNRESGYPSLAESLDSLRSWLPEHGVREQLDMLLRLVESRSNTLNDAVPLNLKTDAALVWTGGREDMLFLVAAAVQQGRLESLGIDPQDGLLRVRLTFAGYLHLEEIDKSPLRNDRVFVAMWFDSSMSDVYDNGLSKGIRSAGYSPLRVDREPAHGDRIDAHILVAIRRSRAMVADATGVSASVMYEAGFAEGLGKPVIWTVRKGELGKLPFDTRQLLHIVWETPEQLAKDLRPVIEHRLGARGPSSPSGQ